MGYNTRVNKGDPHMKFQVTHNITRNGKVIVTKGDVITEQQVIKKRLTNYVIPYVGTKNRYTQDELETIGRLYTTYENRRTVVSQFLLLHGNTHTNDSVNTMCSQCETLDNTRPSQTELVTSQGLRTVLHNINPNRFM